MKWLGFELTRENRIELIIPTSSALYSDALNSISDVIYSLMIILGLILAIRPPDSDHPQGHTRFEPLLAIVISL